MNYLHKYKTKYEQINSHFLLHLIIYKIISIIITVLLYFQINLTLLLSVKTNTLPLQNFSSRNSLLYSYLPLQIFSKKLH